MRNKQYQLVLECCQSGLSDYNWCLEHNIKPGTFYNCVKRLRKAGTYVIPKPAGRATYQATLRQDIVKVELVEEPVKFPRQGYHVSDDEYDVDTKTFIPGKLLLFFRERSVHHTGKNALDERKSFRSVEHSGFRNIYTFPKWGVDNKVTVPLE
ncbi:MAG: hypothetical protein SPF99_06145 [Anaerobutyricum sp.]|nr:hypothetical protein [Anaerobutyricum sp.]